MAFRALVFLASSVLLRSTVQAAPGTETGTSGDAWDGLTNGLQVMYNAYQQCESTEDLVSCLKLRALRSADRALRQDRVSLFGGLSFVKEPARAGRRLSDPPPVDEVLPATGEARSKTIDDLLMDRLDRFFKSHTLQMDGARLLGETGDLPATNDATEEGRGKGKGLKKHGGLLLMGLIMKSGLMALAWKGVALVAAKALMIAKIALILAVIVALKKSHHGDEKSISIGHESDSEYKRRSIVAESARRRAQILAYNAHVHHAHGRRPGAPPQMVAAGSQEGPYYHYPPAEEYQQQLQDEYLQQQQEQEQLQEQMAQEQAQEQLYAYQQ